MREKLGNWPDGPDDVELAWALLGLGIIQPRLRRDHAAALAALWTTLGKNAGQLHRWRFDSIPTQPYEWSWYVSAAAVAKVMRASVQLGALRVAMVPGSPLSTPSVWDFVRRHVPWNEAALHIVGQSANRPCHFRWPLRIGYLPGPRAEADVAAMAANDYWGGNVFSPGVLSRRRPECDVLVWSGPSTDIAQDDIARAGEELDGVLADVVLLFDMSAGPLPPDLPKLDKIRASVGASGIALVPGALLDQAQTTRQLCEEISHNNPIDRALSLASSGQALLMASKPLLDASLLQNKARSVARVLTHTAQAHLTADPNLFGPWAQFELEAASATDPGLDWQGASADGDAGDGAGIASAPAPAPQPAGGVAVLEARRPTRREIGDRLEKGLDTFEWLGESHEASALGRTMRALDEEDVTHASPRYLQAAFVSESAPDQPLASLMSHTDYLVNVFIDVPHEGYLVADVAFPAPPPPDDGREHDLQVVFWEPRLQPEPLVSQISLPTVGPSGKCAFKLHTDGSRTPIDARITVLHRNRVLQTGRLTAPVDAQGQAKFVLDAVPRQVLNGLDERLNFSMALVLNDTEGKGAAHVMAGNKATVLNVDDAAIAELVRVLGMAIGNITVKPSDYQGLRAPGSEKLLRTLAQKGAVLRKHLERHSIRTGRLDPPGHVQVVSTKPGKIFPLEFIYQYEVPDAAATLCPGAEEALEALARGVPGPPGTRHCLGTCPDVTDRAAMENTICPLGFWGVRCAIERKPHTPEHNELAGEYVLLLEPMRASVRLLRPLAGTVIGATDKANLSVPTAVAEMVERIRALVPGAPVISSWSEWPKAIRDANPATLTLVVHQEPDENGTPTIDIGSMPFLSSDLLKEKHVRAQSGGAGPLVLLIGCETGKAGISYENFALRFQDTGAALVVSTIAEVLGRQAAPVAADILEVIHGITEPTSFAEVMRSLRCRLLAKGTPMVLALVAQGDADWEVVA